MQGCDYGKEDQIHLGRIRETTQSERSWEEALKAMVR